jgi:hypothetical protein
MTPLRPSRRLGPLLALGLLAGPALGCETASPPVAGAPPAPPSASQAVVSAAPSTPAPAAALPTAKAADNAIVIGERQTFRSSIMGEDRTILVYTPPSYKRGKATYPVIYLLDGDGHFHHTTGITQFLADNRRAPEMIVVGVANTDRTRDLTPTNIKDNPGGGGGAKFLSFLKDELRTRIEGAYRTTPYRILIGHSLGGLFAIHALATAPDAFNAYVSISPSLWWDDEITRRQAEELFAKSPDLQSFLYVTLGKEPGRMADSNKSFTTMLKAKAPKGLKWSFTSMERENHVTIPHRTTYDALETLFAGWEAPETIDTVKALQAHYDALSKKFSIDIKIPENALNNLGYQLMASRKDESLAAFQLNVKLYPDSANVYDSLAEAYEKSGKPDLAKTNYEMAVRKATETSDPALAVFKQNLDRFNKSKAATTAPAPPP